MIYFVILSSDTIKAAHIGASSGLWESLLSSLSDIVGVIITVVFAYYIAKKQIHNSNKYTMKQIRSSNDSTRRQISNSNRSTKEQIQSFNDSIEEQIHQENESTNKRLHDADQHFEESQSNKYIIWSYEYLLKTKRYVGNIRDNLFNTFNKINHEKPKEMEPVNLKTFKIIDTQLNNAINDLPDKVLNVIVDINILTKYILQIIKYGSYKLDRKHKVNILQSLKALRFKLAGISHNATSSMNEILSHSEQIRLDVCYNLRKPIFDNYKNRLKYIGHDLDGCMDDIHHIQNLLTGADTSYDKIEHIVKNWTFK